MFLVTLCVFYLIFYLMFNLWQRHRLAYKDAPKSMPLFKCLKIFYGDLVISDPEDSTTVLKACTEKDIVYQIWEPWLGVSAFIGNIQTNKLHRKLYAKSLMPSNMDAFFKFFNMHSERFVQKFSTCVEKGPLDMVQDLRLYNLELLCDTFMAFNELDSVNLNQYLDAVSTYHKIAAKKLDNPFLQHDFFFKRTELKKKHDTALETLHHTSDEIIRQRRRKWKEIRDKKCEPSEHVVFLDVIFEAVEDGVISEEAMRSEVDGLIFAGHDTSAYSLLYTLVLIGSYPEVQERAFEEVQQVLGDRKIVTKEDLAKMVYLEAIIKESVRLYPYVAFLPRCTSEDVKLKNCVIRAGCTVLVCSWEVHRHESWGPNAQEFHPERWLDPEKLPKHTILLSFSEGPRNCIGRKYAMYSMKTLLAYLLRSYRFTADHTELRFEYLGVLEPLSGHHVTIENRL